MPKTLNLVLDVTSCIDGWMNKYRVFCAYVEPKDVICLSIKFELAFYFVQTSTDYF